MRINKYIAKSGYCSRRKAEELILEKRVKVNKKLAIIGMDVKDEDIVYIDNKKIDIINKFVYIAFNKPKKCITSANDEFGRKTVFDYIKLKNRLFPIGRLDYDTTGLLILTNDGELYNNIIHPKKHIEKRYIATVKGRAIKNATKLFKKGFDIDGKKTLPAKLELNSNTAIVTIVEGRNRQVRKMLEYIGLEVVELKRESIGNIKLNELKLGKYRHLTDDEVRYLKGL